MSSWTLPHATATIGDIKENTTATVDNRGGNNGLGRALRCQERHQAGGV